MEFKVLTPTTVHPPVGYSHAVRMGNLVFVAGQVAKNEKDELVGKGDAGAQTAQVYRNLKTVLEAAGSGMDRVGKINVYTTSLDYRRAINAVRDRVFGEVGHFPASTFAVISSLAHPDYLVEIEAVATVK
ncbi:MAG: RidA family protein [Candidatus Rokubacteria bacterium]|nr:RidA family protein [Candidatus Rokubacteria bacterium]